MRVGFCLMFCRLVGRMDPDKFEGGEGHFVGVVLCAFTGAVRLNCDAQPFIIMRAPV